MLHPGARPVHAISRGPLEDVSFLTQDLILPPQPLQFARHVLLPAFGRMVDLALASAVDPVPQGRHPDPEILGNGAPAAAAGLHQPDRLILKLLRKALL